ncbi:MAG: GNAT family N-acetyltransferase [Oscillibacter sp.]
MKTKRLVLRKWTEADAESLYEYAKDSEVEPYRRMATPQVREESLDVIRNVFNGRGAMPSVKKRMGRQSVPLN